jgi:agmatinase
MGYLELYSEGPTLISTSPGGRPRVRIIGVPFDATSTFRPGSRFGPDALRAAYKNLELYLPELGADLEVGSGIEDVGNLRWTASVEVMAQMVERVARESFESGLVPGFLGGEHTLTYAAFKAAPRDCALLVLDAHLDLREEYGDLRLGHATHLRRLVEEVGGDRVVWFGVRAASSEEWGAVEELGLRVWRVDQTNAAALREALSGADRAYVSIDLDVLDPGYAPAVGNPEPGGLAPQGLLELLAAIKGVELVGFDVVELCPPYDRGETAILGARVLAQLLALALQG